MEPEKLKSQESEESTVKENEKRGEIQGLSINLAGNGREK